MRAQLPDKLNRRAVKQCFDRLPNARWDYLFLKERTNGLHKARVKDGPFDKAYYATNSLIEWLIMEGYYTPAEFSNATQVSHPFGVTVRKHIMAG